ncbi:MAG: hypothetical protein Q8878_04740 [Bacillota bacterium]|nr:hypothetical protein [Bacillota bacterium]
MTVEVSMLIAIAGCFIGLAGWLSGRDKKIAGDAEWRGEINGKLNMILGMSGDIKSLGDEQRKHGERLTAVEESAKQAHKRLDRLHKAEEYKIT